MFNPGGLFWFDVCLNCFIHVVMYTYYGLSAIPSLKGKFGWKKYNTGMQLIKFCIIYIYIYTNFIKHNRHFMSTYFLLDPFEFPY